MILPINALKTTTNIKNSHKDRQKDFSISSFSNSTDMNGIPRSYISFGSLNDEEKILREEERRRAQIAKYLEYKSWNPNADFEQDAKNEIDAKRKEGVNKFLGIKYVKASEKLTIKEQYRQNFEKQKAEYDSILANESYYQNLLKTDEVRVYEQVKKLLEKKPDAINNRIAGYQNEKKEIRKMLIEPILRETALDTTEKIPPAVMIYGPIRCGKTEFSKGIAEESGCNVDIISNIHPNRFVGELLDKVIEAKENYIEISRKNNLARSEKLNKNYSNMSVEEKAKLIVDLPSPRTIIIIDDIDRYFNLETKGNNEDLIEHNKTVLKGLLDHCSEKPNGEYSIDAAGISFILTSNYPSAIDSEISLRRGKCDRLPVTIPNKDDVGDIAKFYLEKGNNEIQKAIDEGRDISLINIEEIPFDKYGKFVEPSKQKGALSGSGVKKAVNDAVTRYIENPDETVGRSLPKLLTSSQYRISNEKLAEFQKEMDKLGLFNKPIDEKEEYQLLKDAKQFEMLSDNMKKRMITLEEFYSD